MNNNAQYAVWGNPIQQSLSPIIHQAFAKQTRQRLTYQAKLGDLIDFEKQLKDFFLQGAQGCNITAPFKNNAFYLADKTTQRCQLAQACNTLKKLEDGSLLGDNTDGIGLLNDLKRLNILKPQQKVLILGAGGAAQGVIFPLLQAQQHLVIYNRTFSKAQQLTEKFCSYGKIQALDHLESSAYFDLIINATSLGLQGKSLPLPISLMAQAEAIYDMQYNLKKDTPFLAQCKKENNNCYDGLGMLVEQAAESFLLWRGIKPNVDAVLNLLKSMPIKK